MICSEAAKLFHAVLIGGLLLMKPVLQVPTEPHPASHSQLPSVYLCDPLFACLDPHCPQTLALYCKQAAAICERLGAALQQSMECWARDWAEHSIYIGSEAMCPIEVVEVRSSGYGYGFS